jgi:uncharacterized protein (DUF302 family)
MERKSLSSEKGGTVMRGKPFRVSIHFGIVWSLVVILILAIGMIASAQEIVEKASKNNFQQTMQKLEQAIKGAKLLILGEFDYQKMQKMVGKTVKPAKGFNFFRPDLGIPIFENDPKAALEIPLKIAVIEGSDGVIVRYRKPSAIFQSYNGLQDLGKRLDTLVEQLADAATK